VLLLIRPFPECWSNANLYTEIAVSVGTLIVTMHDGDAVNEYDAPSATIVIGATEHPDRVNVPVGAPAPFEIVSVRFTVDAYATGNPAKRPDKRSVERIARLAANWRLPVWAGVLKSGHSFPNQQLCLAE